MCVDGPAKDEALVESDILAQTAAENNKRQKGWCVDDSATERVFIPDGECARRASVPEAKSFKRKNVTPAEEVSLLERGAYFWFPRCRESCES